MTGGTVNVPPPNAVRLPSPTTSGLSSTPTWSLGPKLKPPSSQRTPATTFPPCSRDAVRSFQALQRLLPAHWPSLSHSTHENGTHALDWHT